MYCRQVRLLSSERIAESYFLIGFECEEIAREARPGQFVMVRLLSPSWEYLLSRPFSFCKVDSSRIELFFKVVGKGTRSLAQAEPGAFLEIIGPLGNGFSLESGSRPVLAGGGMGIAPLPFLAAELMRSRKAPKISILLGARTARSLCLREAFADLGATVRLSTDDGSTGHKGPVTELLVEELRPETDPKPIIHACGPKAMLKTISRLAFEFHVTCQVSVEERMACGVGACMSCGCRTRDRHGNEHFKRVCLEGPVFDAAELILDED